MTRQQKIPFNLRKSDNIIYIILKFNLNIHLQWTGSELLYTLFLLVHNTYIPYWKICTLYIKEHFFCQKLTSILFTKIKYINRLNCFLSSEAWRSREKHVCCFFLKHWVCGSWFCKFLIFTVAYAGAVWPDFYSCSIYYFHYPKSK
jgi:hypothetical protein